MIIGSTIYQPRFLILSTRASWQSARAWTHPDNGTTANTNINENENTNKNTSTNTNTNTNTWTHPDNGTTAMLILFIIYNLLWG